LEYFSILVNLYQPFINEPWALIPTPSWIVAEADRNIQTLVHLYYLRHGFETMDSYIMSPLAKLASMALQNIIKDTHPDSLADTRSTLFLTMKGLRDQGQNSYLGITLYRVFKSQMKPEDVQIMLQLIRKVDEVDKEEEEKFRIVHAEWAPSIVQTREEQEQKSLTQLVEKVSI
jgi:hypothetical protein